jgi:hypothetical protein
VEIHALAALLKLMILGTASDVGCTQDRLYLIKFEVFDGSFQMQTHGSSLRKIRRFSSVEWSIPFGKI